MFLYKERELIREFFMSIMHRYKEEALFHASHNEILKNNIAVLENAIDALEEAKRDRQFIINAVEMHEKMNAERMAHIQEVINRIDKTVSENKKNISIITDRIDRG